jgi:hypothetical protein
MGCTTVVPEDEEEDQYELKTILDLAKYMADKKESGNDYGLLMSTLKAEVIVLGSFSFPLMEDLKSVFKTNN